MAPIPLNLIGERFGRLIVISEYPYLSLTKNHNRKFNLVCDCGQITTARIDVLRRGDKQSCGCLNREYARDLLMANNYQLRHGEAKKGKQSPEYICWSAMIRRCENKSGKDYPDYGGRGIHVCKRWRSSYENFLSDMGRKPSPKHSLDRYPDNSGNYEPKNCRWATASEQRINSRNPKRGFKHGT